MIIIKSLQIFFTSSHCYFQEGKRKSKNGQDDEFRPKDDDSEEAESHDESGSEDQKENSPEASGKICLAWHIKVMLPPRIN